MPVDPMQQYWIEANRQEYGDNYQALTWLTPEQAATAEQQRAELLRTLASSAQWGYHNTKLDCRALSPGCALCGAGAWSCLFINGKCPCGCFYCPAPQDDIDVPTAHTVPFRQPDDYVAYLERFRFTGASISGGEPFLTFDTTLEFARAIKDNFGDAMYLWVYTSGILATTSNLTQLRDAGVDEIRFDIGATKYQLDHVRKAVGLIPTVTVEIPAIPEQFDLLTQKLREMRDSGIQYLNLHQLRLTPHNFPKISARNYTFLHGEKVTVLESELTALRLLAYAQEHNIDLPINYCSFVYKHRFQRAAFRRRTAALIKKPYEDITESGYIRTLWLTGDATVLQAQAERLKAQNLPADAWMLTSGKDKLYVNQAVWNVVELAGLQVWVSYSETIILPAVSYRNPFVKISLTPNFQVFVERLRTQEAFVVPPEIFAAMRGHEHCNALTGETAALWDRIQPLEHIPSGLQAYY